MAKASLESTLPFHPAGTPRTPRSDFPRAEQESGVVLRSPELFPTALDSGEEPFPLVQRRPGALDAQVQPRVAVPPAASKLPVEFVASSPPEWTAPRAAREPSDPFSSMDAAFYRARVAERESYDDIVVSRPAPSRLRKFLARALFTLAFMGVLALLVYEIWVMRQNGLLPF